MADYLSFIDKMAAKYGIPPEEARAIYENETRSGKIVRNSPAGAIGQMQLMPGTARDLGVDPNDPYQNIEGGVKYYAQQRKRFGDPALAAAAYNAGPTRVAKLGRVPNIRETQDYVARFKQQLGSGSPSQSPAASATMAQAQAPQGPTTMDTPQGALPGALPGTAAGLTDPRSRINSIYSDLENYYQPDTGGLAVAEKNRFAAGEKRINEMYGGPSPSQMLFALSRALLSPRKFGGFKGTMVNVSEALGGLSDKSEIARQKRAEALARLQETSTERLETGRMKSMELRAEIAAKQLAAEEAAAKANEPKYDPLSGGGYQQRPGTGGGPPMPKRDAYGNFVIEDMRQVGYLPPNSPIVRPGDDPSKPKYSR